MVWGNLARSNVGHDLSWHRTDDYKLVYSPQDRPWLFDLKKEPEELTNSFDDPEYREVVKRLSGELLRYCKKHNDPALEDPQIRAAMTAAAR